VKKIPLFSGFLTAMLVLSASADIGRVYHPYIEQNEREIEYGQMVYDLGEEQRYLNQLGFGYAWSERFFTDVYVLSETVNHDGHEEKGYELEAKWQLTEQGEYWADWGFMLEAGTMRDENEHELAAGLLFEKELENRVIVALNTFVEYEFGNDVDNELETALRSQLRHRFSPAIEPALEIYLDDKDYAAGPALMGMQRLGAGKRLKWECGWMLGLDQETPNNTLRALVEFEF